MKTNKVLIFDTTLRDGEQAPGATMSSEEKLEIAFSLERLGVDIIEAGFPVSSKGDFDSVQNVARHIKDSFVCGLARCVTKDIDAVIDAVKPAKKKRIHIFLATSKIHLQHKLKKSQEEIVAMAVDAVKYARKRMDNIEFSPEDASRTEKEFLYRILEAVIKAGATTVNIPDTVGYSTPHEYGTVIAGICQNVPNIGKAVISTHCHDDLGLAVANSLSGVQNGARQVECTINGIGERAGNASMEEIVMALKTRSDFYHLSTNIKTNEFYRISRMVSKATGFIVPPNKAVVGANAFRHESGIHQDGILKERRTYEIMNPEDVGVPSHEGLVLGKHSGRHAFKDRLKGLGIELPEVDLDKAFVRFKGLADKKKEIYDEDLVSIVEDQGHLARVAYSLVDLIATSGTNIAPQVVVTIGHKGKKQTKKSTGDGPVDACYKAIEAVTKLKANLLDYGIKAVTQGKDALGEVTVKVAIEGETIIGRGASTDIIEASAKAYINAINKFVAQKKFEKMTYEPPAIYGIIGNPVAHSLSPVMHNAAFKALKVNAVYKLFPLADREELKLFMEDLKEEDNPIFGYNVTVPYKEDVLPYLDTIDPLAEKIGAVNTVVIDHQRKMHGFNTDGAGFLSHLTELKFDLKDKRIAILGAGGTTRAIVSVLCLLPQGQGPERISLYNRTKSNAEDLLDDIGKKINIENVAIVDEPEDLNIELADLLINTTKVGMNAADPLLIDPASLHKDMLVYDVIYKPAETALLAQARSKQAQTANGLGMLFYQGVLAFWHWSDVELDERIKKIMRNSLKEANHG